MKSKKLFERAKKVIPGGVNSPVRAFNSVGGTPVYIVSGSGPRIKTAEGTELVDYCGSWGPLILGHARKEVVEAIQETASKGTSFGINTPREVEMAELLCDLVPGLDMIRLVNSGTEAVMTALRIARGFTNRRKIIKFEGCYHGHTDSMLVSAGSGLLTGGISSSAGVSKETAAETFVVPYNDLNAVLEVFKRHGNDIAAVIIEPVAGNMGLVQTVPGFLQGLRDITARNKSLLIFDEVITGFRLAPTTYGRVIGITPDLTCLGKIIGGGMPIGAIGGKADIMRILAPLGSVYQAGTLSGNPVAVAAGLATLKLLKKEKPYPTIAQHGKKLAEGITQAARKAGIKMFCPCIGGMFTPFFCDGPVTSLADAKKADTKTYAAFFHGMLDNGIYLPPSQFEVGFISATHTDSDIIDFIEKAGSVLIEIKPKK
ncbi:MAG: glutamate-1-semialdehyde 2,1-aminomutase [Kiritimatiellae bacterium]|nr:glutamate-1-semialdehyde 2,1-aminomutase [Kiritimatiellia bacterium]MDD5521974.1 glutamate-1-semialdehyde 2,1-aminomutase [Kiritimatiellia bacterium]